MEHCAAKIQNREDYEVEYRMLAAQGNIIWIQDAIRLIKDNNEIIEWVGFMRDITPQKNDQEKIQRLNELYQTLSQVNQAIIQIKDEQTLFESLCHITTQFSGFSMAWTGLKQPDGHAIVPVASAGEDRHYLDNIQVSTKADDPTGQGPIGIAYRDNQPVVFNHFLTDPRSQFWHQPAKSSNFASVCAIPITCQGKPYAIFTVYSKSEDYFTEELVCLLSELGEDLSYALTSLAQEAARQKAEAELYLSAQVFAQSQEAILITDAQRKILTVNQAFTHITGYSKNDVIGKDARLCSAKQPNQTPVWDEIHSLNHWQGEYWNRHKNGEIYPVWMVISCLKDKQGHISHFIANFSDITQHKEAEAHIEHLAHYDALTNLPNRVLIKAHCDQVIATAQRNHSTFTLLFLDLDRFKNINDSLGHSVGDQLLIEVAGRLSAVVRKEDTVARLGGDEFNILLPDTDFKGAMVVAEKIISIFEPAIVINNNHLHISTSIGLSLFPDNGTDYETLRKNADTALYQAKAKGRNQYQFFTPEMQKRTHRRLELETHLRKALQNNEFVLFYQAQFDAVSHQIIGAEALIRWQHPQWGMVSPAEFIPVAEDSGLIIPIGNWVLKTAIKQLKSWHQAGFTDLSIAVNLSMAQFHEATLIHKVQQALDQAVNGQNN